MNTERFFKIVIMDLTNETLKLEQDLEDCINSESDTNTKLDTVKSTLSKIVNTEASIVKFTKLMNKSDVDNKEKK